jgi:N-succinyldiaminopimelate aminotransferase
MSRRAARLDGLGTTVFTEMTALAASTGSINLGQGFPDTDGPSEAIEAAVGALRGGENQYAPLPGVPALREAVLEHQREYYGLEPEDVLVTFGATEAIAAALLALCDPGDEVVVLEPYYDSYAACIAFAGAKRRPVTLRPPDFALEADALRAALGPRARVLLLNSPHNPTGRVLNRSELEAVAAACVEHDLICVTDEVYEHLVFEGRHIPIATLPGMAQRTLTISSVGKSFSFTGWKIGWCSGPAELVAAARTAKQFLTFAGGTPLQHAAAAALRLPPSHLQALCDDLRRKRDQLCAGLSAAGLRPLIPAGTYFVNADIGTDAVQFCAALPQRVGIVAIPTSVFYDDKDAAATLVRFAFCKRQEVIAEAAQRLRATIDAPQSVHPEI